MLKLPTRHLQRVFSRSIWRWSNARFASSQVQAASLIRSLRGLSQEQKNPLLLRDYQEECIQSVLAYLEKGEKRLGVSLATGSGKTVIFTQLIDRVKARKDATQTLILVHRRELVEQAAKHCIYAYPEKTVEVEMGSAHASGTADITVASIYSITSGNRMAKFDPSKFKLILVDESHHIVASSFMQTLEHFRLLKEYIHHDSPALVGVSATFSRFDGLRLSEAIDHIVYHKDYLDMMEEKWLSQVIFTTVKSKANLSRVRHGKSGEFQVSDLSQAVNTHETNEITVRTWMTRAGSRKSTLVFCVDLAHVNDLTATFRSHGFDAKFVTGETPKQIRDERLCSFKNGEYPVLLNCGVFMEGTDIPNIDCILLARPTKSLNLLVQMIGRGMRLHSGKVNCHVIDMVASLETGIVTTPTLFGLDPAATVSEANLHEMKIAKQRNELKELPEVGATSDSLSNGADSSQTGHRRLKFTDYQSVYDLIDDTSGEQHIRRMSSFAWVAIGENRYVLSSQEGSYVTIESSDIATNFSVFYTQKLSEGVKEANKSNSPFMRPRKIAESIDLLGAVHAADTFASRKFPRVLIGHSQAWRKGPASESQIAFLNKMRPVTDQLASHTTTKGKANDMITKVKFGAKGWFSKITVSQKREQRATAKSKRWDQVRQLEKVKVGPLAAYEIQ